MERISDNEIQFSEVELVLRVWFEGLVSMGSGPEQALRMIDSFFADLPVPGLSDPQFRKYLLDSVR